MTVSACLILVGSYWLSTERRNLLLFEAVEHVGHRHAVQALVVDVANGGFFADKHIQEDALFGILALDAQILEVAGVPERVEIALDGDGVVGVALVGKHAGEDGFFGDAPVANDANLRRWCPAVCAKAATALDATASSNTMRANRCAVRIAREMEVCLIFTGFDPCGGHKFSFVPLFGFTGRICTPSLLKIWPYIKERSILQDRAHPAQTPRPPATDFLSLGRKTT